MPNSTRKSFLLAIDPGLTSSGWVQFELRSQQPVAAGVIVSLDPSVELATRIAVLQERASDLLATLGLGQSDWLVCEGPAQLVLNPQSSLKLERVRGVFEVVARDFGVTVPGRVNPRTVQAEIMGLRGKQIARAEVKQLARKTSEQFFGARLKSLTFSEGSRKRVVSQDIVDASLIGLVALSRVRQAMQSGVSAEALFEERTTGSGRNSRNGVRWNEAALRKLK